MILQNQSPLVFKSQRLENEWHDPRLFTILRPQVLYTNWLVYKYTDHWTRITSLYRFREEQEEICRRIGKPFYWSTHNFWRAADQAPLIEIPRSTGIAIASRVSLAFPYSGSPGKKSCRWHDVGLGSHFHHQAGYREPNYRPDLTGGRAAVTT